MRLYVKTSMPFVLATCLLVATTFAADNLTIEQKDKAFVYQGTKIDSLKVKVGDTVNFKNMDSFFHNVFSLSDSKMFDLGSYPQGQFKSVTFDKKGKVEVECAIHPLMHMIVEVK
jgi:plastocyanin